MKVTNRSDGNVTYTLPELNTRRVFQPNETKEIEPAEMESLFQIDGGALLIKHYLLVDDEAWVDAHWDAPAEYFWTKDDIVESLKNDSLELFQETLEWAPDGVKDLIKLLSWDLPLTDLNKINLIRKYLNFDVQAATKIMAKPEGADKPTPKKERLRQRKER